MGLFVVMLGQVGLLQLFKTWQNPKSLKLFLVLWGLCESCNISKKNSTILGIMQDVRDIS